MESPAIVFVAVDRVELQPLPVPPPGPHEIQVRTTYSSISAGTEGWALHDQFTWSPTPFPCVPGYQRVGTITALGSEVQGWRVGDQVVATNGQWTTSPVPHWGAHIGWANTRANEIYAIPDGVDLLDASATVVAQVGYNAVSRLTLDHGAWIAVYGDGLIGQCAAQVARARGAHVLLVGHRAERLALAAEWSADAVIDPRSESLTVTVQRLTGTPYVSAIVDTVQTVTAQTEYLPILEYARGQIVYAGFTPGTVWADMAKLQQQELTTYFVQGWTRPRMDATLALMAHGALRIRPLLTHIVPADHGPAMYTLIQQKTTSFLGITLDWEQINA